jgi:hypothetical protein
MQPSEAPPVGASVHQRPCSEHDVTDDKLLVVETNERRVTEFLGWRRNRDRFADWAERHASSSIFWVLLVDTLTLILNSQGAPTRWLERPMTESNSIKNPESPPRLARRSQHLPVAQPVRLLAQASIDRSLSGA